MEPGPTTASWFDLGGRVALVTGAGRGIGAAIAVAFAGAGADVAIAARTQSELEKVADEVGARGRRALVQPVDVSDLTKLADLVEHTVAEFGRLDILVNNAGGSRSYPIMETRVEHLRDALSFNVLAPFELSRLAIPYLLQQEGASIINISSMVSRVAPKATLVHGTTKAAIAHMTRLMATDLAPRIRVNGILPGAIETEALKGWLATLAPEARATMRERTAMRRNGTPEDIAAAAVYLAGSGASWVTGKLLEIDGAVTTEIVPKDLPDL
jgi:7-alpha-hydroxysteroid dehydrogenase